jgi:hypothetical protein
MSQSLSLILCLVALFAMALPTREMVKEHHFITQNPIADFEQKRVPVGGNSWLVQAGDGSEQITNEGFIGWKNKQTQLSTYLKVARTGTLKVSASIRVPNGESQFAMTIAGKKRTFSAKGGAFVDYQIGEWQIPQVGYVRMNLEGLSKTGATFGDVQYFTVSGTALKDQTAFVPNNGDNYFHWGRRGPSVHLAYSPPTQEKIEWFYNEITVPEKSDVIGSYFMANGFKEGYFGIQLNSPAERRILFSVWSPYQTDNPSQIPDDQKIKLLKKGNGVVTKEFGNEGSGGQSFLRYNWRAGQTYKFLLRGKPAAQNYTEYTAYFFAPERGSWQLIAHFSRPKTNTYLTSLHSFLENFIPDTGNRERMAHYSNQWICTKDGKWLEITHAKFTADATARKGYRMDYAGGINKNTFYLRNCGFFNDFTPIDKSLTRPASKNPPSIDFASLP